jgi:hypothetical protein
MCSTPGSELAVGTCGSGGELPGDGGMGGAGAAGGGPAVGAAAEGSGGGAGGGAADSAAIDGRSSGSGPSDLPRSGGGPDAGVKISSGSPSVDKSGWSSPRASSFAAASGGWGAVSLLPQFGQRRV